MDIGWRNVAVAKVSWASARELLLWLRFRGHRLETCRSPQQQTAAHNKDSRGNEDKNISSKEDTNYINNKGKNPTTGNNNDEVKDTSSLRRQGVKGDNV